MDSWPSDNDPLLIFVASSHMQYFWHIIWTQIHFPEHQTLTLHLSEVFPSVWLNSSPQSQRLLLENGGPGLLW